MRLFILAILLSVPVFVDAQKYKVIKSYVRFYSEAPVENIEAVNMQSSSIFDLQTGKIAFSIPIREFHFDKKLMREHFNENYLESDKFPNATFQGKITNFDINKTTLQPAIAKGLITIHGVERDIEIPGEIQASTNYLKIKAKFNVTLEDYDVKIPSIVYYNISEIVEVTILFDYAKM